MTGVKLRAGFLVRVLGTAAGLAYVATQVDPSDVRAAFARIPFSAFAGATLLVAANVLAGVVRWRVLMSAYGATRIPSLGRLTHLYAVGFFYNTYLPGAVVGDVGRGVVTRDAFEHQGAAGALAVVLVERALGLLALFALLAIGLALSTGGLDTATLWWWTVVGTVGSIGLVVGIAAARALAPRLPEVVARHARRLPRIADRGSFAAGFVLSFATQALIAAAGWVLLAPLAAIGPADSLLVVPLAAATTFLPITVGGAGAREAVYVALCGQLFAMPHADALAASLGLWLAHLVVGALGGIAQLLLRGPSR